jgi:large subunit ribosomal protein L4
MTLSLTILNEKLDKKNKGFDTLSDFVIKPKLLAEVIKAEMSNERVASAHAKTRAEVSGGGKKPWKQKGTGRARHGSTRSPIWVKGGVAHGPRNDRNWHQKINRSARLAALKSLLKDRLVDDSVFELPATYDYLKTSSTTDILNNLQEKSGNKIKSTALVYTTQEKTNLRGFVNSGINLINAGSIKIYKMANNKNLILTPGAKELLEAKVAK